MIQFRYQIRASTIPGAGRGLFLAEAVPRGRIVIAPDRIDGSESWPRLRARPDFAALEPSVVRWFEEQCTTSPDWPDECYVNHDFEPTGLWHLGFVFARFDLAPDTELTVDYRHLLPAGEREAFDDARSGLPIIGFDWRDSLRRSAAELLVLL